MQPKKNIHNRRSGVERRHCNREAVRCAEAIHGCKRQQDDSFWASQFVGMTLHVRLDQMRRVVYPSKVSWPDYEDRICEALDEDNGLLLAPFTIGGAYDWQRQSCNVNDPF